MRSTGIFILVLQLVLGPQALADSCRSLFFTKTLSDVLEQINRENNGFLTSAIDESEPYFLTRPSGQQRLWGSLINNIRLKIGMSYNRQQRVFEVIDKFNLSKFVHPVQIENLASELSLAMFGPRHAILSYFSKSKGERFRQSVLNRIGENIIREGLMNTWKEVEHESPGFWKRFYVRILKTQNSQVMSAVFSLPFLKVKDNSISDKLMAKVIVEGFDANEAELRLVLRTQNYRDTYNSFRNSARNLLILTLLATQVSLAIKTIQADRDSLASLSSNIETSVRDKTREAYTKSFARAKETFKEKMGRHPTAAEEQELYGLIILYASIDE
ncbi:MAG: hypothetical protein A4S09_10515 [Proteobacteria bacterium SG_bin7]|nr:MAG: hypothetical protein A4S09_10515 [Proteobacteria bacterium SG_bin7]